MPCMFAAKYNASHSTVDHSSVCLAPSSIMVCCVSVLRAEIDRLLDEQMRAMPIQRVSSREVDAAQANTPGSHHAVVAAFSLAALLARQVQVAVGRAYEDLQLRESAPGAESSFRLCSISVRCTDKFRHPGPSTLPVFSARFVDSLWRDSVHSERRRLLAQLGVTNLPTTASKGGKVKRKSEPELARSQDALAQVHRELRQYCIDRSLCDVGGMADSWLEVDSATTEREEWVDLESGGYEPPVSLTPVEQAQKNQDEFLSWCVGQDALGAALCEYVSTCPILKLFLPTSAPPEAIPWPQWASAVATALEGKWVTLELMAGCDGGGTVESTTDGSQLQSRGSGKNSQKKKRKSKGRKTAVEVRHSSASHPDAVHTTAGQINSSIGGGNTDCVTDVSCQGDEKHAERSSVASPTIILKDEECISDATHVKECEDVYNAALPTDDVNDVTELRSNSTASYGISEQQPVADPNLEKSSHFIVECADSSVIMYNDDDTNTTGRGSSLTRTDETTMPVPSKTSPEISVDNSKSLVGERVNSCRGSSPTRTDETTMPVPSKTSPEISVDNSESLVRERVNSCRGSSPPRTDERIVAVSSDTSCEIAVDNMESLGGNRVSSGRSSRSASSSDGGTSAESSVDPPRRMSMKFSSSVCTSASPHSSPSLKNHKGDYICNECDGDRVGTDSTSRMDLLKWDQQRRLADVLTEEIIDMAGALHKVANMRRPWQTAAIDRVRGIVQSLWGPHARCEVFGSFATGLAIPSSDIDIVVSGISNHVQWWGGKPLTALAVLSHQLEQAEWVSTVRAIEHAPMPVIKLTTAPVPMPPVGGTGERKDFRGVIKVDITIATHTHGGSLSSSESYTLPTPVPMPGAGGPSPYPPYSSPQQQQILPPGHHSGGIPCTPPPHSPSFQVHQGVTTRDFVLRLCAMNPDLIPLVLVMKQFLQEKGLHDPFTGGLSSYAVTIMVASIIHPHALERPETKPDLGTMLLSFLRRFGTRFDTRRHAVVLSINGPFAPLAPGMAPAHVPRVGTPNYWRPADPVVVTDPLDSQNNLGRSCFGFRQLQTEFDNALERVMACIGDEELLAFPTDLNDGDLSKNKRRRSVLGAMFGTTHHDSVVRLQAQIWCPQEVFAGQELCRASDYDNATESEAPLKGSQTLRQECEMLLACMTEKQLLEAKNMLMEIRECNH
eukprot:CAMPEP_0185042476 /NCGR_PEP_ID=MMETSP1103-20130426/42376_1 /TAXON_ID=36769 /ORGANISM="Paraphysomonas bandaiensis, Strain Caron Lab Isolate" /LENGTH=1180 /DNA_ID=CAMNT_0027582561 /DNA_START=624 /DNA_END=4166 /DNA_ORIENTATION=-